jgi:DNA-directed RNA polymerase specialized sigma24 family protein
VKVSNFFRDQLTAVYQNRLSFDRFAANTITTWRGIAAYLMRRWTPPVAVLIEDVVQELLIGAWHRIPTWDPQRGPIHRYVVWNACTVAKRWLHRQRGANLHRGDTAKSRFHFAISTLNYEEDTATRVAEGVAEATQEEDVSRSIAYQELQAACLTKREQYVLAALRDADGNVDDAAEILYEDCDLRLVCRLGSIEQSRRLIKRSIFLLTQRISAP